MVSTIKIPFCSNAPLLVCGVLNDGLLSIYDVLLELMRQHTFGKESQKDGKKMNHLEHNRTQTFKNINDMLTFDW